MKYIIGNWKMNALQEPGLELAQAIARHPRRGGVEVVLCPPVTLLAQINAVLDVPHPGPLPKGEGVASFARMDRIDAGEESLASQGVQRPLSLRERAGVRERIKLGAQDCSPEAAGAHTGDISAGMLKDIGCSYVIVGHSERRMQHGETNETERRTAAAAVAAGLTPIVCVGESQAERESGRHLEAIAKQVAESIPGARGGYLIAYEPVWAIGSGKTPSCAQIGEVHKHIAKCLGTAINPPIVYGGSVKAGNARDILHTEGVGGVLVGGASLQAVEFCGIIDAGC